MKNPRPDALPDAFMFPCALKPTDIAEEARGARGR